MENCHVFEPRDAGWYERKSKPLSYNV